MRKVWRQELRLNEDNQLYVRMIPNLWVRITGTPSDVFLEDFIGEPIKDKL